MYSGASQIKDIYLSIANPDTHYATTSFVLKGTHWSLFMMINCRGRHLSAYNYSNRVFMYTAIGFYGYDLLCHLLTISAFLTLC